MKKEIMILIMIVITGLLFITLLAFRDFVGALLVAIALVFEATAFESTRNNI